MGSGLTEWEINVHLTTSASSPPHMVGQGSDQSMH